MKQQHYCPDCYKQRKRKSKKPKDGEGPLFTQNNTKSYPVDKEGEKQQDSPATSPYIKTFRDNIHGDIDFYDWEVAIIDTADFQRLRGIKQLGLANYVYPGALHTRFEHSLGTVYMAQKMIDSLKNKHEVLNDSKIVRVIRLVALLHDIGHLPFGHTFEDEYGLIQSRHDKWQRIEKYIGLGTEIGAILVSLQCFDEVKSALRRLSKESTESSSESYISDLVGNTICADLFDYLKRDGNHCGLNLEYDERLLKYFEIDSSSGHLVVRLEKDGEFRRDNVSELVGLLQSRYSLAEKVLFHHTKLAAGAMLARAFLLEKVEEKQILNLGDEQLLSELEQAGDKTVVELVQALRHRKFHKVIFRVSSEYADIGHTRKRLTKILHRDQDYQESLVEELEERFNMPKGSLCIYCPDEKMLFKAAEVLIVANSNSEPEALSTIHYPAFASDVASLKTKHVGLWTTQLFLNEEQYPKAVLIAEAFKRIMSDRHHLILLNDLDVRPSARWRDVLLRYKVVDSFALEKSLPRPQEEHLHLELEKYSISLRKGSIESLEAQYRQACEEWWRQVSGK